MFIPIRIYKRSKKATAVSVATMVLSILLILIPVIVTLKVKTISVPLFLLYVICFAMAAAIVSGRDKISNQIAERELLKHQTS